LRSLTCLARIIVGSNCDRFQGRTKLSWYPALKAMPPLFVIAIGIEIPRVNCKTNFPRLCSLHLICEINDMHITLYYYIYFYSYIYFNNSLKRIFLKKFDSKGEKAFREGQWFTFGRVGLLNSLISVATACK